MSQRWLVALSLFAACGGSPAASPDAAPPSPDADPSAPNIHVTVRSTDDDHAPIAGATVVFTSAAGDVLSETTTDADGRAAGHVADGDNVTAVYQLVPKTYMVSTVMGVHVGDDLSLLGGQGSGPSGTMTVTVPPAAGADSYVVWGPCGQGVMSGTSGTLTMWGNCSLPSMELQAFAYDASFHILGYLHQVDVPFQDTGTFAFTGTWQAPASKMLSATGVPAGDSYQLWYDAPDLEGFGASIGLVQSAATSVSGTVAVPLSSTALLVSDLAPLDGTRQQYFHRVDPAAASHTVDVTAVRRATISTPVFDRANARIDLAITGDAGYDGYWIQAYQLAGPTSGATDILWDIYVAQPGSYHLPVLPASVGPVQPLSTWRSYVLRVVGVHAEGGSWDQVRADGRAAFDPVRRTRTSTADLVLGTSPDL